MADTTFVSTLLREDNPARGGSFSVRVEVGNPELLEQWLQMGDKFQKQGEAAFGKFIFQVHRYLIRVTPIDTGELRGGWTAWLDKNQEDYSKQINDISLIETPPHKSYHFAVEEIEAGRLQSDYVAPSPLDITIINNVEHGFFLEAGTSRIPAQNFVERARYKAEFLFGEFFEKWFEQIAKAEDIVPPEEPEEIGA